jgi:hypothetical protein
MFFRNDLYGSPLNPESRSGIKRQELVERSRHQAQANKLKHISHTKLYI